MATILRVYSVLCVCMIVRVRVRVRLRVETAAMTCFIMSSGCFMRCILLSTDTGIFFKKYEFIYGLPRGGLCSYGGQSTVF